MTKDNWIKAFRKRFVHKGEVGGSFEVAGEPAKDLEDFIFQVEKDAEERGYQLGLRDGIKKEHENSGAWTDLNKQGVINTHKLIKDAKSESYTNGYRDGFDAGVEKTNKRWLDKCKSKKKKITKEMEMELGEDYPHHEHGYNQALSDLLENERPYIPDIPPVIIKKAVRIK